MFDPALISTPTEHCRHNQSSSQPRASDQTSKVTLLVGIIVVVLPVSPRQSTVRLSRSHWLVSPRRIFSYGCGKKEKQNNRNIRRHMFRVCVWRSVTGCRVSPGDCGDLLSQRLDVGELDGLSSSSGFHHVALKTEELTVNLPLRFIFSPQ